MLDKNQRLTSRIDIWAVQRVTRNDLYIRGKILIEGSQLRSFAGGLTADNRTDLGRGPVLRDYLLNSSSLYTVDNIVANPGDQVPIW